MKLLLDTNVVLDYFGVNQGFEDDAENIIALSIAGEAIELISAASITDIYYTSNKRLHDHEQVINMIRKLRKYVLTVPVTNEDIEKALNRDWKDFEDAVQYTVAESNSVDFIITRNKADFEEDDIPCLTPKEFLEKFTTE